MPRRPTLIAGVAAMVMLSTALSADAAPGAPAGARAFAERLVAVLNKPPPEQGDWGVPVTTDWYDAGWVKLYNDGERLTAARGADNFFEADPICGCEHPGFHYSVASVTLRGDGMATLRMRSFNGSDPYVYPVTLKRGPAGWRIYSVVNDDQDWRAKLVRDVACLRKARTAHQAEDCNEL